MLIKGNEYPKCQNLAVGAVDITGVTTKDESNYNL